MTQPAAPSTQSDFHRYNRVAAFMHIHLNVIFHIGLAGSNRFVGLWDLSAINKSDASGGITAQMAALQPDHDAAVKYGHLSALPLLLALQPLLSSK